jgi:hypothetical protein
MLTIITTYWWRTRLWGRDGFLEASLVAVIIVIVAIITWARRRPGLWWRDRLLEAAVVVFMFVLKARSRRLRGVRVRYWRPNRRIGVWGFLVALFLTLWYIIDVLAGAGSWSPDWGWRGNSSPDRR